MRAMVYDLERKYHEDKRLQVLDACPSLARAPQLTLSRLNYPDCKTRPSACKRKT